MFCMKQCSPLVKWIEEKSFFLICGLKTIKTCTRYQRGKILHLPKTISSGNLHPNSFLNMKEHFQTRIYHHPTLSNLKKIVIQESNYRGEKNTPLRFFIAEKSIKLHKVHKMPLEPLYATLTEIINMDCGN